MNQLRAFYLAAKLRSIAKAAQELMVTPPAVSKQIRQLEESLGLKLLYRDGNSIKLTEIGNSIFKRSKDIFGKIEEMESYFEDLTTAKTGELRIGCTQTPAKYIMPALIARFKDNYPGIKIVLDQGTSSEMIHNILNNINELALMRYRPNEKRLKVKVIREEELILIAARHSRHINTKEISISELSYIPLIVPKEGSGIRDAIFEYLSKFKIRPNVGMESGSVDLIKEMVRQDKGVSFLERYVVEEELKRGFLKAVGILEGSPKIELGVGYLQRRHLSPPAWAFLRMLENLKNSISLNLDEKQRKG